MADPSSTPELNTVNEDLIIDAEAITDDHDSTYDERTLHSTQSLSSSIFEYEEIHGRTYQTYHDRKYMFPNDEIEQERVDVMYHVARISMGERPFYAPIGDNPSYILDIGTGTGIWAVDVADAYPLTMFIATDVTPIQPQYVADADDPWTFAQKFDLVHTRLLHDCTLKSWPRMFESAMHALRPGGWIECQEMSHHRMTDDNSIAESSFLTHWENVWTEGMNKLGFGGTCQHENLGEQMRAAGFEDVTSTLVKIPIGPWPKDKTLNEAGKLGYYNLYNGLEGARVKLFTQVFGWSIGELHALIAECRREMKKSIHAYWPLYVVTGRKPGN